MRVAIVIRHISTILLFNAIFLFISFLISVCNPDNASLPLLYSTFLCVIFGTFPLIFVPSSDYINTMEGVAIVTFGWIVTCLIGAIPYILWGGEFNFINAWFESVSGFTTTGSTILNNVEALPQSMLFWRSSTHWIGGIGVILFALLILPEKSTIKHTLINTEMSDIARQNFKYRARKILYLLILVYLGLTIVETICLSIAGMSFFDAINHSFATIATGGFSTKNLSVAHYNSLSIEIIIIVFMFLSGIHFGILYATFTGKSNNVFTSPVVRLYFLFMVVGILLISLKLYYCGDFDFGHSFRYASFQVISLATTTGFATYDTAHWPDFTKLILIYFTLQCACVGSTSGGLKFDRVLLFVKMIGKQVKQIAHPRAVFAVKFGKKTIPDNIIQHTLIFIILYLVIIFISSIILTASGVDSMSAFSGAAATIGNVGPGFGIVSSLGNFSTIPASGKFVLTINMLLGRLEIFGVISLFFIKSWK